MTDEIHERIHGARQQLSTAVRQLFDQLDDLERLSDAGKTAIRTIDDAIAAADDVLYDLQTRTLRSL